MPLDIYMEALIILQGLKIVEEGNLLPCVIKTDCKELIDVFTNNAGLHQKFNG